MRCAWTTTVTAEPLFNPPSFPVKTQTRQGASRQGGVKVIKMEVFAAGRRGLVVFLWWQLRGEKPPVMSVMECDRANDERPSSRSSVGAAVGDARRSRRWQWSRGGGQRRSRIVEETGSFRARMDLTERRAEKPPLVVQLTSRPSTAPNAEPLVHHADCDQPSEARDRLSGRGDDSGWRASMNLVRFP